MPLPALVWIAVGAVTLIALAVVAIGVFREVQRVAGSTKSFADAIGPDLAAIQQGNTEMQERVERLQRHRREEAGEDAAGGERSEARG